MNIVVTGFEPFNNDEENPTQEVIRLLPKSIKGHMITGLELPVVYKESFSILEKSLLDLKPEIVICLGLASGRKGITPERIAVNMNNASITDNNGLLLQDQTIIDSGENAYFSQLPLNNMITVLKEKHIDCSISNSAGLYVCNDIMYRLLHYTNKNKLDIKAGFIHVPLMDEQEHGDKYSMPLDRILEGVIDCIKTCL